MGPMAREPRANPGKPMPASTRPSAVFSFIVDAPGKTWIKPCRRVTQPSSTSSPRSATDMLHSTVIESRRRWRIGFLHHGPVQMHGRCGSRGWVPQAHAIASTSSPTWALAAQDRVLNVILPCAPTARQPALSGQSPLRS